MADGAGVIEYWTAVRDQDFAVPADRDLPELVDELCEGLASPDPRLRDHTVYPVLATWVERGVVDHHALALGESMIALLEGPIQARCFATLIVAELVDRDTRAKLVDETTVRRWYLAFAAWWEHETDIRGWDADLGWLHAIAHGADTLGAFAGSRHLTGSGLRELLDLAVRRLVAETDYLFGQLEDDRLARAIGRVLIRPELTAEQARAWLDPLGEALHQVAGPFPTWAQNTIHTIKSLFLVVQRQAPRRTGVLDRLAKLDWSGQPVLPP